MASTTSLAAGAEGDRVLEVAGLGVDFDDADGARVRLLRGVDLDVRPGEVVALVGESGCGKSLTAKAVLGLLPSPPLTVVSGRIALAGRDLLALDPRHYQGLRGRVLTLVPQHPLSSLNPVFTVGQQFFDLICFQGAPASIPSSTSRRAPTAAAAATSGRGSSPPCARSRCPIPRR